MSYTRLRYHLVTATKHREPLLIGPIAEHAYAVLRQAAKDLDGEIKYIGGIDDHVHAIADIHPTVAVSDFVRDIKTEASKAVGREFPSVEFNWQIGYGAFTLNPFDMSDIISYVLNQEERHRTKRVVSKFERVS